MAEATGAQEKKRAQFSEIVRDNEREVTVWFYHVVGTVYQVGTLADIYIYQDIAVFCPQEDLFCHAQECILHKKKKVDLL